MRRHPTDLQPKLAHALPCRLVCTLRTLRRLKHKHRAALLRHLFDQFTRIVTPRLLIAAQQQHHRAICIHLAHKLHGRQRHHHPGLHIQHPWPIGPAVIHPPGHSRQRPHGPHGIQVAQQQHRSAFIFRISESRLEDAPAAAPSMPRHPCSPFLSPFCHRLLSGVYSVRMTRRTLLPNQRGYPFHHFVKFVPQPLDPVPNFYNFFTSRGLRCT